MRARSAAAAAVLLFATLGSAPQEAAMSVRAIYASIDAAAVELYLARALADPAIGVGDAEPCLRTDNMVSSRPSPLAAPPFPAASIAQRADLVRFLAQYEETMAVALTHGSARDAGGRAADLAEALSRVTADASRHQRHDLAIASLIPALTAALAPAAAPLSRDAPYRIVAAADPAIRRLIALLGADTASAHADAVAAARAAYAAWSAVYARTPGATRALVRCASSSTSPQPPVTIDPAAGVATDAMRAILLARIDAANARYRALLDADPAAMLTALGRLNDMLNRAAGSSGQSGAAPGLDAALAAFHAEAGALAEASAALDER